MHSSECSCISYDACLDLNLRDFVEPRSYCKTNKGVYWAFGDLEYEIQKKFKSLFQHTSPQADFNKFPTLIEDSNKMVRILNFTDQSLTLHNDKKDWSYLHMNERYTGLGYIGKCYLIAYQIPGSQMVIVEENSEKNRTLDGDPCYERLILVKSKYKYENKSRYNALRPSVTFKEELKDSAFFARHPISIQDVNDYLSKDACMKKLVAKMDKDAILKPNPSLIYYGTSFKMNGHSCKILNHTDHKITLDICNRLHIDGFDTCQTVFFHSKVIVYHLKDEPEELICFEQIDDRLRFFALPDPTTKTNWTILEKSPENPKKAFYTFLKWHKLSEIKVFPEDVILEIFAHCLRLLNSLKTTSL